LVSVDTIRFLFSTLSFPASTSRLFRCQEIQCPSNLNSADVITYSNFDLISSTEVTSNPNLPVSSSSQFYRATWDRATIDAGQTGIFTSLTACEGSSTTALDFSFSGQAKEVRQQQARDRKKEDRIPKEILELLYSLKSGKSSSAGAVKEMVTEDRKVKTVSNVALMQELENALKSIH
jgi:hypothetical protein